MTWYWLLGLAAVLILAGGVWLAGWEYDRRARRDAELWARLMRGDRR